MHVLIPESQNQPGPPHRPPPPPAASATAPAPAPAPHPAMNHGASDSNAGASIDTRAYTASGASRAAQPAAPASPARRRFGKAGFVASGVLLTVNSTPGMACDICASPSGSLSGGLQSQSPRATVCAGRLPAYWKAHGSWPTGVSKTGSFESVFHCGPAYRAYAAVSLQNILTQQSFDTNAVGMHLVAAYLNVKAGLSSFQTDAMLKKIWSELQAKGYYAPIAGKKWYAYDIAVYLSGTMD